MNALHLVLQAAGLVSVATLVWYCAACWLVLGAYLYDVPNGRSAMANALLVIAAPVSVWVLLFTDVKPVMAERAAERAPRKEGGRG